MRFDASHKLGMSGLQALIFSAALSTGLISACSGAAETDVAQSADTLKGGTPGSGKDKDKTDKHTGQAGTHGMQGAAGAEAQDRGHGKAAAGAGADDEAKGNQGKGQGQAAAGADATDTHGKRDQARAGSHAQAPQAGHGADDADKDDADKDDADDADDADDENDEKS